MAFLKDKLRNGSALDVRGSMTNYGRPFLSNFWMMIVDPDGCGGRTGIGFAGTVTALIFVGGGALVAEQLF